MAGREESGEGLKCGPAGVVVAVKVLACGVEQPAFEVALAFSFNGGQIGVEQQGCPVDDVVD